jgi:hypothetical protein
MKLKNKAQIIDWLEKGDFDAVLTALKSQLKASRTGKDFLSEATSLSAQWEKIKSDKIKGVISNEEETLALNKLVDKLQVFLERVENQAVEAKLAKPPQQEAPTLLVKEAPKSSRFWWLAVVAVAFGFWWLFLRETEIHSSIKICTVRKVDNLNCCNSPMDRLTLSETFQELVATALFEGQSDPDPLITGMIVRANDDTVFPTEKIQFTIKNDGVCYSSRLTPVTGVYWENGWYKLKLTFNGKPAGEKAFEVFGENLPQNDSPLLPLDSIKVNQ